MEAIVALHVLVPLTLKRRAFSVMALRGLKFSPWVRDQLEQFVAEQQPAELRAQQEGEASPEDVPP